VQAIVWSKDFCPYCIKAKDALKKAGVVYEERVVGGGWTREQLLEDIPNALICSTNFYRRKSYRRL
jgi:glutaredoxin